MHVVIRIVFTSCFVTMHVLYASHVQVPAVIIPANLRHRLRQSNALLFHANGRMGSHLSNTIPGLIVSDTCLPKNKTQLTRISP